MKVEGPYILAIRRGTMRAFKNNPHPIDMSDFYRGGLTVMGGKDFLDDDRDEDYTDAPVPTPTLKSNFQKLRRNVSDRLFSIEFRNISF
jgi:hypothetical protein